MAHSVKNRKKVERHKRNLVKRTKILKKLANKQHKDAITIELSDVALGDLRRRFKHVHHPLHPAVIRMQSKFKRIAIDTEHPFFVRGADGGLLACRVPLNRPELVKALDKSIQELPPPKHYKFRGMKRSEYGTRHYCVWAAYAKEAFLSREFRADKAAGIDFLDQNSELFHHMSALLGEVAPGVFKQFQTYPLPNGLKRLSGAWCGCVINNGGDSPNQTQVHQDVKEAMYGFSCLVSCGDYSGGGLILYDLGLIIEMAPGDMIIFPDSLIHHANESAIGKRSSLVAFTQENMYDYWHRTYNMYLHRKDRRKRKRTGKKS